MQSSLVNYQTKKLSLLSQYDKLSESILYNKQGSYLSVKNDRIDEYLANYNNASGINLGFLRIDEGVY